MTDAKSVRPPLERRAPGSQKTAGIRGDRDAPAAGHQAPLMRDLPWGKRGGLIRGSTSQFSDGSQPELLRLPRSSRRKHKLSRLASPRSASKKENGRSCHVPYPNQFKTIVRICNRSCKKNSKNNSIPSSQNTASESPSCNILSRCESCRSRKLPY